jgi:predicted metalloenzyme YecM
MYDPSEFFKKLEKELQNSRIELQNDWFIDHICYRTKDNIEYEKVKSDFSTKGVLLIESMVGGRLIATYKLSSPLRYKDFIIPLIEIPAPKTGRISQSGYEHIEIVVKESFDELIARFSHLEIKTHALSKSINPELEIEFGDISVKFHHQSLEEVIEHEKSLV